MTTILGIDLGTHCGYGVMSYTRDIGTIMVTGVWDCSIKVGHDSPSLRFAKFEAHLRDMLALGVERVFYELVRAHKGPQAGHVYGGFLSALQRVCDEMGVPFQGLEVGEVKKAATGKGNASKDMMIEAARTRGHKPKDDNEADAIAIMYRGRELMPDTHITGV
jgi:crossover junction endodeoxyribonuclease RuvC